MDTEIRLAKVEVEVESCATALSELREDMNRRFAESEQAIADLRSEMNRRFTEQQQEMNRRFADQQQEMDRRFAEQAAEIADLRKEMRSQFKWMMGTFLAGFAAMLGVLGRIAGLY